jgi:hypothetical protein
VVGLLVVSAVIAGFLIGRWWSIALAFPLFVAVASMYDQDQELTFVGFVIVVAGLIAAIQAGDLAVGAASRWAATHRDEAKEILRPPTRTR